MSIKVFVDSDVVISSLISERGAAYFLIHQTKLDLIVSNLSIKEMVIVSEKLGVGKNKLNNLIRNKFKQVELKETNDAHIVGGARKAQVKFLISYNIKDFKVDKIKRDFDIIVTTPANFLQYLRGLSNQ